MTTSLRGLKTNILDIEGGGDKALDLRRRFNDLVGGRTKGNLEQLDLEISALKRKIADMKRERAKQRKESDKKLNKKSVFKKMEAFEVGFQERLNEITSCKNISSDAPCGETDYQCKGMISKMYVNTWMIDRAEYIFWYESEHKNSEGKKYTRMDGFALAYRGAHKHNPDEEYFYIDLLCSNHRKGGQLLQKVEEFAKDLGFNTLALRAASASLFRYYRSKGFRRMANACKKYSRHQRSVLRHLDEDAIYEFRGRKLVEGEGWWMSKCI